MKDIEDVKMINQEIYDKLSVKFEELLVKYAFDFDVEESRVGFRSEWENCLEEHGTTEEEWLDLIESRLDILLSRAGRKS